MMSLSSNLSEHQRRILEILLKKYESSRTFKGKNKVTQTFSIKPDDVFEDYYDDFTDIADINRFEEEAAELEQAGLVSVEYDRRGISRIIANKDALNKYPTLLGVTDKLTTLLEAERILRCHLSGHDYVRQLCEKQLERIAEKKKQNLATDNVHLEQLLCCLDYILNNHSEILERELSIELFGDSKLFEKTLRSRVCALLSGGVEDEDFFAEEYEKSVKESKILEYFFVAKNPTYFYLKGNCEIHCSDGAAISITHENPIALCSSSIATIISVVTPCRNIMTIENLTSFNRMQTEDTFFVYLSGYNNTAKTQFLKKLYEQNLGKTWLHFGDIDPDGFYILANLRKKTGIDFLPHFMGICELEKYRNYCKPLEQNDIKKANSLTKSGLYPEVICYLLENNCKLEQEIISWKQGDTSN